MPGRKTAVLIHGCNLHIENWRYVAWGEPPDAPGRIPHGIAIARQFDAKVIVMGTGASAEPFHFGVSGGDEAPLLEAEYSWRYLDESFDQLAQFEAIRNQVGSADSAEFLRWRQAVTDRVVLDTESQNTVDEITRAFEICLERGIEQIILVSSPSHVVRALRDAASIVATDSRFRTLQQHLFASPSVTCYEGSTPGDVVVVEPPHRPDRHVLPTHRRIQRMLDLQRMSESELVALIEDFDQLLQRYEHRMNSRR